MIESPSETNFRTSMPVANNHKTLCFSSHAGKTSSIREQKVNRGQFYAHLIDNVFTVCYRAARKEGGNPDKSMKLICLFFAPKHPYCPLSISDSSLLLHLLIPDDVLGRVCSLFQS